MASLAMIAAGCEQTETVSNIPTETDQSTAVEVDAEGVTERLKAAGLPVTDIVVVTEETDDNNMMGRPGQYVSKTFFVDGRYRGQGMSPSEQNTVEVFPSEEAATKRREYIEAVTSEMPMFNQYQIQSGPVLLRLDKVLKPAEAREYEAALAG